MGELYDSILTDERRQELAAVRSRVSDLAGRDDLAPEVAEVVADCARLTDYAAALESECFDLDVLYSTTVAHAAGVENELMRRNEEVSEFLANMSHELRTPLNAIIGYGELALEIAEEEDYGGITDELRHITVAGRHLLGLINDVLDLSKIEAGRMELAPEQLCVPDVVRDVVGTVEPLAARNDNRLRTEIDPAVDQLWADGTRLRQCLTNLLGNACKFTRGGSVVVRVAPWADGVQFDVTDTGIGMTDEQMTKLFQPFRQADATTARHFGGTGLGLAITRRLTEAMGGTITVRSKPGEGSTFTICLPRHAGATPAPVGRR